MAKCYKFAISKTSTCDIGPIHQAPDGLQNPRETKAFAIENWAGKWSIATVQMGNNFAHTVRDHLYLGRLEQIQRAHPAAEADRRIARLTMPDPEQAAAAERQKASDDAGQYAAIHRLALEALTVLYRLADYYPPEWLTGQPEGYTDPDGRPLRLEEGKYLARAARDLLLGWQALIPREGHPAYANWQAAVLPIYGEPLRWFETGIKHLADIEARRVRRRRKDPPFDPAEVQSGILTAQGSRDTPMAGGALLLMTIADASAARTFLAGLRLDYEGTAPADDFFRTLGFTADGLRRIGLETAVLDRFPKEFREGMAQRSGLLGDMRENHPRNWTLPRRNWPPIANGEQPALPRPPVELSEVDIVLQIRTANTDPGATYSEIARLADRAAPGLQLLAYEMLAARYAPNGALIDHFGLLDGVSQPRPARVPAEGSHDRDQVRLGEIVTGYANDRGDAAPGRYASDTGAYRWRAKRRKTAQRLQFNGSYLAIRKLEQRTETFAAFIAAETARINRDHPTLARPMTAERLKALMIGRYPDGRPLVATADGSLNDFDYVQDTKGEACPFASHVRRANPRNTFLDQPAPRILRRGMSFDQRDEETGEGARGLMFMAYGASLAEQYETIQRWINGGNSSFVASGHNDPLLGIAPKTGTLYPAIRTFRFVEQDQVIRVAMPEPFVALHWGLYLFVPSRTALSELTRLRGDYHPMDEVLEASGKTVIDRLEMLDDAMQGKEWKRLLEDFGAKDPAERNISPDMWAAIRWYRGGAIKIEGGTPLVHDWNKEPDRKKQPIILTASYRHVMRTLTDWRYFTTEEQLRRIENNSGPIYVTQQPDNRYRATVPARPHHYRKDAEATNAILMAYDEEGGYTAGYAAGRAVLDRAQAAVGALSHYRIELRRQYLLPALGELCQAWYGLPDGIHMHGGGWLWEPPAKRTPPGPRCPGDFLSPSRNAFYPRPSDTVAFFADGQGQAILDAARAFVEAHRPTKGDGTGTIAAEMFKAIPTDDELLARNLIGTMIGAIPPMDGNLRGVLLEWLTERTLWRHQAALRRAFCDGRADSKFTLARDVLFRPISQALCKRPAPDLLYRTVTNPDSDPVFFKSRDKEGEIRIPANERDLVVTSLVSASQETLRPKRGLDGILKTPDGDVSIIFGGRRRAPYDPRIRNIKYPVHACPAREMALGAIMGIMAALLDAGRIQALPASLIVRISDW